MTTRVNDADVRAKVKQVLQQAQAEEVQSRYELLTGHLLDAVDLDRLPVPKPLIDGVLNLRSLNWLQGKPGHGKSFIALDIACHVAQGRPWYDRAVHQGPVLFIAAEGAYGLQPRLTAWEVGYRTRISKGLIRFLPVAVQLLEGHDLGALGRIVHDITPALIVIDTQARVTVGGEENSSRDMGRFVDNMEYLARVAGSAVLIVHHEARAGENLRGSSAMEGAADTIMRSKREGRGVTLTCLKQKDRPEFEPIFGTLRPSSRSAFYSHEAVGVMAADTATEDRIVAVMRESFGSEGVASSVLMKTADLSSTSFYRAKKSLVYKRILHNIGTEKRPRYVLMDLDTPLDET